MGGMIKLVTGIVVVLVGFFIWRSVSAPSTPATAPGGVLAVTDKDWVRGPVDAPATLIEYTDFQCPACGAYHPIVGQLMDDKDLTGKLRLAVRHFPLIQIHKNALTGARAAEAAGRQGKFWEMYDQLFSKQNEWSLADDPMKSILPSYAEQLGLNVDQFKKDVSDSSIDDKINHDRETANTLGINGTPTFYLNGEKVEGVTSFDSFKKKIVDVIPSRK